MKKTGYLLLTLIIFIAMHEGLHAIVAAFYGEFEAFNIRPYGFEVTFETPVEQREGAHWAIISGLPNLFTIMLGYSFFAGRNFFAAHKIAYIRNLGYFFTVIFMLLDPFNLSVIPFFFGGDAYGISFGLQIPVLAIQVVGLIILILNRELCARFLLPAFNVKTSHPLFKPWFSFQQE
jgi:hypothetical protein